MRLDPNLHESVIRILRKRLNANRTIASVQSVSGGCISTACRLLLDDGGSVFLKFGSQPIDMFEAEADGLAAIDATGTITVPNVLGVGSGPPPFILLSWIDTEPPASKFWQRLGHQLAALHTFHRNPNHDTNAKGNLFGYLRDNFIGVTRQPNAQNRSWTQFFAEQRIDFQARLALQQSRIDRGQFRLIQNALPAIKEVISEVESTTSPSLVHGDLWRGNVLCGIDQTPYLIDPAVHFAHSESELAMPRLFGGFADRFQRAYDEQIEPQTGRDQRIEIYQLYHLLNHLNLFGAAYWPDCQRIVSQYL